MAIDLSLEYTTVAFATYFDSFVFTKPTNTVDGDFLLAALTITGTEADPTCTGWTKIVSAVYETYTKIVIYYKRASSEGASWSFSWPSYDDGCGFVKRITGVIATGDPEDCVRSVNNADYESPMEWSTITTATDGAAVIGIEGSGYGGCTISASTLTERIDIAGIGMIGDVQTTAGATGEKTATFTPDVTGYVAILLALKPAAGAPIVSNLFFCHG